MLPQTRPFLASSSSSKAEGNGGSSSDGERIVHRRSKTGCLVCRARRIKCDLGRPECAKCIRYGAECGYPAKKPLNLIEIEHSLQKRHQASRSPPSGPVTPRSPRSPVTISSKPTSPISGSMPTPSDRPGAPKLFDDGPASLDALHALCRMTRMGSFFVSPMAPPDILREQFSDPDDLKCLHHCMTYTFSILVIKEEPNPWLEHVAPLLFGPDPAAPMSTNALRLAMLNIGATHLAYLHNRIEIERDSHFKRLSIRYRQETIRALRQAKHIHRELISNTFLAASILLVYSDCLASDRTWREAWRGCLDAVYARGGCDMILFGPLGSQGRVPDVEKMLLEQMSFVDIMASMSAGEPPSLLHPALSWWERLHRLVSEQYTNDSIEDTKGVQRHVFHLVARTNTLVAAHKAEAISDPAHRVIVGGLNPSSVDPGRLPDGSVAPSNKLLQDEIVSLADDVYRWFDTFRAHVMHKIEPRTRIGSMTFWHMINIIIRCELQHAPKSDASVQDHAKAILDLCVEAGDKIEYLNWPLLIASCVLSEPGLRERSRGIIKLFAYQCCHEIIVIRDVVKEVWRRMDEGRDSASCHYLEVMVETGRAVLLG